MGKTYAMLNEGRRRAERGTDVVIGFVGAARPAAYRGAARRPGGRAPPDQSSTGAPPSRRWTSTPCCARHPQVALVDELAHTNVPGSGRHEKRWEDVLELLDAGIDVITTVNIQHLESLADAVEQMTGAQVKERVPDWVVRKADQIELVDSSPEQLRRRMLHGNIYPAAKVPQALTHFFRTDNLIALRELALRFLADETEEDLLEHLRRHQAKGLWETDGANHGGRHRRPGHRHAAAAGGPHRIAGQGRARRGPRRPETSRDERGPSGPPGVAAARRQTSAPAGTSCTMTIRPAPSPASPVNTRSPRSSSAPASAAAGRN